MNPENLVAYFKRPLRMSTPEERLAELGLRVPEVARRWRPTSRRSAAATTSSPPASCRCATAS